MIKIKTKINGTGKVKIVIFLLAIATVCYLYSNTLLLTNKINLYVNKQFLFKQINSSSFLETDFLKSHINSALPIMQVVCGKGKSDVYQVNALRWFAGVVTGFDIKNPRTIVSSQFLIARAYDSQITSALGIDNESKSAQSSEETADDRAEQHEVQSGDANSTAAQNDANAGGTASADKKNVSEVNISTSGSAGSGSAQGIYLKNATNIPIDIQTLLNEKLSMKFTGNGPEVLIIHTHTSESYTPTSQYFYTPTDTDRTEDPRFSVVRVGDEMTKVLQDKGISVIHDTTVHDYPSYNGSYTNCLKTIQADLKKYPSIKVVLDIHRDAMMTQDGTKLKVCAEVEGQKVSQVMLVVGTNQGGLEHPNWKENLKFALRIQSKLNQLYPKLARPIDLRKERFNQHATNGSLIIEVGSNGNTLEESIAGGRYAAVAVGEVIKSLGNR